jgi:hypothetical protein
MALLGLIVRLPSLERATSYWLPSLFSKMRRWFFGLLLLLFSIGASGIGRAQEQSKEYEIKAAFLFHFAQFVKWPPGSFPTADAPFCIGILGDDPFGSALEATVNGETIDNHLLTVVRSQQIEDLKDCQMIFVCRSEESQVGAILSQLDTKPVLTVSDVESFASDGGDIDFYLSDGKVRFEINPQAARRCQLKISSQLLSLGKIITGGN